MNLEALNFCINSQDWGPVQKDVAKRQLRKWLERKQYQRFKPLFLHRYCCARLHLGDYSDYTGWEWRSEDGWAAKMLFEPQPLPRWDGGYVERLWIIAEQGVGDEVFYASILPECMVRVKEVVYESDPRLHGILQRSLKGLKCVDRVDPTAGPYEAWKHRSGVFLPAGDLMRVFRRDIRHFPGKPYLRPDPDRIRDFDRYRGRVGLAWRGRQGSLDPLGLGIADPLSVQYGDQLEGIESPPIDLKDDLEGLFALCSVLKKVVTVPQSVLHFAGSIGTKVEIIHWESVGEEFKGTSGNVIPWDYSPRITKDAKLPWYKDVKVYESVKDWKLDQVVQKMTYEPKVSGFSR